jgi:hypothetical protein
LKRAIWKWSLHGISNDYGIGAIDFASNNNTIIRRFLLVSHNIQKGTLQSPATRTNNEIDRVLIDGRHASSVMM